MTPSADSPERRIALFQRKEVRRTIHANEWWFVIADVVAALTDSVDPQGYIKDMRRRDPELSKGWGQIATPLLIETSGGPQKLNCANTEGLFRLIQSIPSPKAEPFKRWLAKVGYERIQEIEDPELATKRTRALYKAKGYSDDWIEKRMRSIAIRDELTGEWKKRGVKEQREYAILIAGLTPLIAFAATTHAEDETNDTDTTTTSAYRSPWADESNSSDPLASSSSTRHSSPVTSHFLSSSDPLLPKRNPDDIIDQRPTRKVYDVDNRGDRELYPDLIIEPSIYDRYEVYETDRDGLAMEEPKAIIKHGLHDSYEVYKTDRDGLAADEPHLVIKEGVYDGEYKVYETDRYGMPEDIPSKVIKTDRLGRQQVYRTDRYGMPIGDPIDERVVE